MKVSRAEVLASSKISHEILGEFTAALHSANFEFSQRSYIGSEDDFKGEAEDPRRTKKGSTVEEISVHHEQSDFAT